MGVEIRGYRWDGPDGESFAAALAKSRDSGCGILFGGVVGSGKTTAALLAMGRDGFAVHCFTPGEVERLAGWREWLLPDRNLLLDDLGRDGVKVDFGEKSRPVGRFIAEIYDAHVGGVWSGRLYATTNLFGAGLREFYDQSTEDRLRALCAVCKFTQNRRPSAGTVAAQPAAATRPATPEDSAAAREDAAWEAIGDDPRADAVAEAERVLGVFDVAWRVARYELGAWGERECAAVAEAMRAGLGRPRFVQGEDWKNPLRWRPGLKMGERPEDVPAKRPFDLSAMLSSISWMARCGRADDARWFASRVVRWMQEIPALVSAMNYGRFPPAARPAAEQAVDWTFWEETVAAQKAHALPPGVNPAWEDAVASALHKILGPEVAENSVAYRLARARAEEQAWNNLHGAHDVGPAEVERLAGDIAARDRVSGWQREHRRRKAQ